jgi:hypothetical protein
VGFLSLPDKWRDEDWTDVIRYKIAHIRVNKRLFWWWQRRRYGWKGGKI